jgi:transposase InsO family protein
MVIQMKEGAKPYRTSSRNMNPLERKFVQLFGGMLEKAGIIWRNGNSKYCSPVNPVMKPEGKRLNRSTQEWTDEDLLKYFRLTIDYRVVNSRTEPHAGYMPFQASMLERVKGSNILASFDLIKGFWQMPLHESSQEILSFLLDGKVVTPGRVMQGHCDSALYFQHTMEVVLDTLLYESVLVWIDDILLYAKNLEEYLKRLDMFLALIQRHGLKLNPAKCDLWRSSIKWCGRIIDGHGVRNDPDRVQALCDVPYPSNAGELQQFLCAINWMRTSIPRYAQLSDILNRRFDTVMSGRGRKKRVAANVPLELSEHEKQCFDAVKNALHASAELSHVDETATMCLFTDASDTGWAIIVTQVRNFSENQPIQQQTHELLNCQSGMFKGAQLQWSVIEKEAYPIAHACSKLNYLLMRPKGFHMYCDHKNLIHVFAPDKEWKSHVRGKLMRWANVIGEYRYIIEHIDGAHNLWADMMSRWGQKPPPATRARAAVVRNMCVAQELQELTEWLEVADLNEDDEDKEDYEEDSVDGDIFPPIPKDPIPVSVLVHRKKRGHTWSSSGRTAKKHKPAEPRSKKQLPLRPLDTEGFVWPTMDEIRGAQTLSAERPPGEYLATLKVWVKDNRIWLPGDQRDLLLRVLVVAHCGSMGHRGHQAMRLHLKQVFWFANADAVIKEFLDACLLCPHVHGGMMVRRPYSPQWRSICPNQGIHFDYLYMGDTWGGCKYILVLKDDLTHYCELVACETPTTQVVVDALLAWGSRFGMPEVWISDQGTHFKNKVMKALAQRLKVDHQFSLAYCPWRNGTVERLNRDIIQVMRILLREYQLAETEWEYLLPVVQANLNMTKVASLKGASPCQAFTALEPKTPLDVIIGDVAKELRVGQVQWSHAPIRENMDEIRESLKDLHREIVNERDKKYWKRAALRKHQEVFNASVGDYVLWSRVDERRQSKLLVTWVGPYRIKEIHECSCIIENLLNGELTEAHTSRLKLYAEQDFHVTQEVKDSISSQGILLNIRQIGDVKFDNLSGIWKIHVYWAGLQDLEATWESLSQVYQDAPKVVEEWLDKLSDQNLRRELYGTLQG